MPKEGELLNPWCERVSDMGFPVSEDGMKTCEKLDSEMNKRDQDVHICVSTMTGMDGACQRSWRTL